MPFIKPFLDDSSWRGKRVLELGCGEGGNLLPFAQAGAVCVGLDLNESKIESGKEIMAEHVATGTMELRAANLFSEEVQDEFKSSFDLVILKDVIEHIPNKLNAIKLINNCLNSNGLLYIGWPPWYMPFGGHQQICKNRLLKKLPWMHLLPKPLYLGILKLFKESMEVVDELAEIVDYRVTVNQMNRLAKKGQMELADSKWYFINPIYEYKFGLKTREQLALITSIPYLRDFLTTSCYYLLKANK